MNNMHFLKRLLWIGFLFLSGCLPRSNTFPAANNLIEPTSTPIIGTGINTAQPNPVETPSLEVPYPFSVESDAYPQPYPNIILDEGSSPTVSPSVTPSPTITPDFTSTATLQSYTGKPFTIIFIRDGNLWLAEVGGAGERQLTHEPEGWWVYHFVINRRGDRIAYVALKGQFPNVINGMIKQFDLRTGAVNPLVSVGDQLLEDRPIWLDDTHLGYTYTEYPAKDTDTPADSISPEEYHPYNYFVVDTKTGQKRYIADAVDISQSPDGRYLLTCLSGYVYEPSCKFQLVDLKTNQTDAIAEDTEYGWFKGWSSDSKWMLFANATFGGVQTDRKCLIVDPVSRSTNWVLLPGASCEDTSWAFHSPVFAGVVCESKNDCRLRFWGPKGNQAKPTIPLRQQFWPIAWTPDDNRLVLASPDRALWIINMDGTGLCPILNNVLEWSVLPEDGK